MRRDVLSCRAESGLKKMRNLADLLTTAGQEELKRTAQMLGAQQLRGRKFSEKIAMRNSKGSHAVSVDTSKHSLSLTHILTSAHMARKDANIVINRFLKV